jgi:XRE family transcriptional regulator, regulator of sulfur utilization
MCEINKNIAKNLKEMRKRRQLTLEELAEKSGVSKSMLGEIERERTNPTITVLWKIANALKTPLTMLINDKKTDFTVIRKTEQIKINQEGGHAIYGVFPYYEPHRMEILQIDLSPKSVLSNIGHMKGVEEYLFVLEGTVNIYVYGEEIILAADDAIRFAADNSHEIKNLTEHKVKMLNVIYYK